MSSGKRKRRCQYVVGIVVRTDDVAGESVGRDAHWDAQTARAARQEVKRQLSITPIVEVVGSGALPRFELKAKRFKDATK